MVRGVTGDPSGQCVWFPYQGLSPDLQVELQKKKKNAPEIPLCMKMSVMWEKQEVLSGVSLWSIILQTSRP